MDMNTVVAENIKRIREEKKLSLDALSKVSGVSKSMLAQIERKEGNPTVSTLIKVSNGLNVGFDELTHQPSLDVQYISFEQLQPIFEDHQRCRNYTYFGDDIHQKLGVYSLELEPGAAWKSNPHNVSTIEYILVTNGRLRVIVNGCEYDLNEKDGLKFPADQVHSYQNLSDSVTRVSLVLYLSK